MSHPDRSRSATDLWTPHHWQTVWTVRDGAAPQHIGTTSRDGHGRVLAETHASLPLGRHLSWRDDPATGMSHAHANGITYVVRTEADDWAPRGFDSAPPQV